MLRQIYKKQRPVRLLGRTQHNIDDHVNPLKRNCQWPTTLMGTNIKECNFVLDFDDDIDVEISKTKFKLVLVRIPRGTKIYHATISIGQKTPWFELRQPSSSRGVVWFASTYQHTGPIQKTHVLTYIVEEDLVMIFEYNLMDYGDDVRGFEYVNRLHMYIEKLKQKGKYIDGYIGCNECEIGILNESITKISKKPENITEMGIKYID